VGWLGRTRRRRRNQKSKLTISSRSLFSHRVQVDHQSSCHSEVRRQGVVQRSRRGKAVQCHSDGRDCELNLNLLPSLRELALFRADLCFDFRDNRERSRLLDSTRLSRVSTSFFRRERFVRHLLSMLEPSLRVAFELELTRSFLLLGRRSKQVYFISKARINIAKKQFSTVNNDYEITFDGKTEIEAVSRFVILLFATLSDLAFVPFREFRPRTRAPFPRSSSTSSSCRLWIRWRRIRLVVRFRFLSLLTSRRPSFGSIKSFH